MEEEEEEEERLLGVVQRLANESSERKEEAVEVTTLPREGEASGVARALAALVRSRVGGAAAQSLQFEMASQGTVL